METYSSINKNNSSSNTFRSEPVLANSDVSVVFYNRFFHVILDGLHIEDMQDMKFHILKKNKTNQNNRTKHTELFFAAAGLIVWKPKNVYYTIWHGKQ